MEGRVQANTTQSSLLPSLQGSGKKFHPVIYSHTSYDRKFMELILSLYVCSASLALLEASMEVLYFGLHSVVYSFFFDYNNVTSSFPFEY